MNSKKSLRTQELIRTSNQFLKTIRKLKLTSKDSSRRTMPSRMQSLRTIWKQEELAERIKHSSRKLRHSTRLNRLLLHRMPKIKKTVISSRKISELSMMTRLATEQGLRPRSTLTSCWWMKWNRSVVMRRHLGWSMNARFARFKVKMQEWRKRTTMILPLRSRNLLMEQFMILSVHMLMKDRDFNLRSTKLQIKTNAPDSWMNLTT